MHIGGISSGAWQAMAGGIRAGMRFETMSQALGQAGLLDDGLAEALRAASTEADTVTRAGIEAARLDVTGSIVDILA